jgi:hypothetical protein
MTTKQGYENVLTEVRKAKAPSLHLEDYNYWMRKGIFEYLNERYIQYDTTQQLSDDLQALADHVIFSITQTTSGYTGVYTGGFSQVAVPITVGKKYGSDFIRFKAPDNYWHFLGSHVTTVAKFPYKCYPRGFEKNTPSKRLTADAGNGTVDNAFLKPSFQRPYHSFGDNSTVANVKPDLFYYIGDLRKFGFKDIYIDYLKEPAYVKY